LIVIVECRCPRSRRGVYHQCQNEEPVDALKTLTCGGSQVSIDALGIGTTCVNSVLSRRKLGRHLKSVTADSRRESERLSEEEEESGSAITPCLHPCSIDQPSSFA
jgi:hypothetical protein